MPWKGQDKKIINKTPRSLHLTSPCRDEAVGRWVWLFAIDTADACTVLSKLKLITTMSCLRLVLPKLPCKLASNGMWKVKKFEALEWVDAQSQTQTRESFGCDNMSCHCINQQVNMMNLTVKNFGSPMLLRGS